VNNNIIILILYTEIKGSTTNWKIEYQKIKTLKEYNIQSYFVGRQSTFSIRVMGSRSTQTHTRTLFVLLNSMCRKYLSLVYNIYIYIYARCHHFGGSSLNLPCQPNNIPRWNNTRPRKENKKIRKKQRNPQHPQTPHAVGKILAIEPLARDSFFYTFFFLGFSSTQLAGVLIIRFFFSYYLFIFFFLWRPYLFLL